MSVRIRSGPDLERFGERLVAVVRLIRREAVGRKRIRIELAGFRVVFDDQDERQA